MAILTKLYLKDYFIRKDINFLLNNYITEYDISKANISILLSLGKIDKKQYDILYNYDRIHRQITIGNMIKKDKELNKALSDGFKLYRKKFFDANNIEEQDVLSIKKDAIFLLNRNPDILVFDEVYFIPKNKYTSYIRFKNIEMYYYYNMLEDNEYLHIKGIDNNKLKLHEDYILEFIKVIFMELQNNRYSDAIKIIRNFEKQFKEYKLPVGYYRSFDYNSSYLYNTGLRVSYEFENITEDELKYINLHVNYELISNLYKVVTTLKFSSKNRP